MLKLVSCVVRSLNGNDELVRIEDSFNHKVGERVVSGRMASFVIRSGPSQSHSILVWSPRGATIESKFGATSNQSLEDQLAELELLEAA